MSLPPHICSAARSARSAGNSDPDDEDLDLDITPRPAHSLQHLMGAAFVSAPRITVLKLKFEAKYSLELETNL